MTDNTSRLPNRKITLAEYARRRELGDKTGPLVSDPQQRGDNTEKNVANVGGERTAPTAVESETVGEVMEVDQEEPDTGDTTSVEAGTAPEPPPGPMVDWLFADPAALEVLSPALRHKSVPAVAGTSAPKTSVTEEVRKSPAQSHIERDEETKTLLRRIDAEYEEGYPSIRITPPAPAPPASAAKDKGKARATENYESNALQPSASAPVFAQAPLPYPYKPLVPSFMVQASYQASIQQDLQNAPAAFVPTAQSLLNPPFVPFAPRASQAYRQQASSSSSIPQNPLLLAPSMSSQATRAGAQNPAPAPAPNPAPPQQPGLQVQPARRPFRQVLQAATVIHWRAQNQGPIPENSNQRYHAALDVARGLRETSHALDGQQYPRSFAKFLAVGGLYTEDEIMIVAANIVNRSIRLYEQGTSNLYYKDIQNHPRGADAELQWQARLVHFIRLVRTFKNAASDVMCGWFVEQFLVAPIQGWATLNDNLARWNQAQAAARMVAVPPQVHRPLLPPAGASSNAPVDLTGDEPEAEDAWKGRYIPF